MNRIMVVGAGIFGSVIAERIATQLGKHVTVIDKRDHIGGNCWSEIDPQTGVEVHKYGSHIFHTSNKEVWDYISRFTEWNGYRHQVWTRHEDKIYPMPINLATINSFYGLNLNPRQAEKFIREEAAKEGIGEPQNLEEKAISQIGRPLYEAFIRGYTIKQWEKDPKELSPDIITRLPVRFNYNIRYFNDRWEGIPLDGYGAMFKKMLDHPLIEVKLNTDWFDIRHSVDKDTFVIYTGPIDQFFDYRLGRLEWRTVDFEVERFDYSDHQGTTVINNADEASAHTRIHEFKHYHPEREDTGKTVIFREYSRGADKDSEPYYPVNTQNNRRLYAEYEKLAKEVPNVVFGGRLGQYKYLDMDKSVDESLINFSNIVQLIDNYNSIN